MSTAVAPTAPPAEKLYTTADLLALPDDGVERWLIDGRIHEFGRGGAEPMTVRNKHHSRTQSLVNGALEAWRQTQPKPRGHFHAGEAGVRLSRDPELTVGIDLVYLPADVAAEVMADDTTTLIDAVPVLAVEILSPSDTLEDTRVRRATFREAGIPLVWFIDPYERTVRVHRPGRRGVTLEEDQELIGDPELPGFRVPVARLFADD